MSRLLASVHETKELWHKRPASFYHASCEGLVPKSVKIGTRAVGWPTTEVQRIINARIAGRTNDEIKALVLQMHAERQLLP